MRTILSLDNDQNGDKEKIREKRILEDFGGHMNSSNSYNLLLSLLSSPPRMREKRTKMRMRTRTRTRTKTRTRTRMRMRTRSRMGGMMMTYGRQQQLRPPAVSRALSPVICCY